MHRVLITAAQAQDAVALAALRVEVMRPSLEAIGRFNPERARTRFLNSFCSDHTWKLSIDNELVGFYAWNHKDDFIWLDHLYIKTTYQGRGIASEVIAALKVTAQQHLKNIRLIALKRSRANAFYQQHGFALIEVLEWDNLYEWCATADAR